MAATFMWCEANGPDQKVTEGVAAVDWKSVDDAVTSIAEAPIMVGWNSFTKYQYGAFSGAYTSLSGGRFSHIDVGLGLGIRLYGPPAMNKDEDRVRYMAPSMETDARLTTDLTEPRSIASGMSVWFGGRSPDAAGKKPMVTINPAYTNYLTTQLRTTLLVSVGAIQPVTLALQYDEN